MFCKNCGAEAAGGARFCERCGAPLTEETALNAASSNVSVAVAQPAEGERVSPNVVRGADGVYRWRYELHLLKNPTIFLLIWKIFFFILLGITIGMNVLTLIEWRASDFSYVWENIIKDNLKGMGVAFLVMTGVVCLGYLLYAAVMGWKYTVIFEMDEKGVNHKQAPQQAKKAGKLAILTVFAGLLSRRPTTVGVGLNAQRTEMYSEFARVRRVIVKPRSHLIKVNGKLDHNQVYAAPEDFEFVKDYILSHCGNLKK